MKKRVLLLALLCTVVFTSCEKNELNEELLNSANDDEFTASITSAANSATLSGCSPTNNLLFDAPVDNTIQPVNRANFGMGSWSLVSSLSDEFNYPAGKSAADFLDKWKFGFVNDYTGPLPTDWTGDQVFFETINGNNRALVLKAEEADTPAGRTLKCGMITSYAKSSYPLFQEARVKISNSQLANAVWMLSDEPGTKEEIDNLEAYGPRIRPDGTQCARPYYADRIHLSHHTFRDEVGDENGNGIPNERLDYQPKIQTWMSRKRNNNNCNRANDVIWSQAYHYFGVKWVSATRLEYFIDGQRVKIVDGLRIADGIDPEEYTTCGDGLTREMRMLISQAAQIWRYGSADDFWDSEDIITGDNTKMRVDWLRVYSPNGDENRRACN